MRRERFELHGGDTTILIVGEIDDDEAVLIEAYAYEDEDSVVSLGSWSVRRDLRQRLYPFVVSKIERWRMRHRMTPDDPSELRLVYADLRRFLDGERQAPALRRHRRSR